LYSDEIASGFDDEIENEPPFDGRQKKANTRTVRKDQGEPRKKTELQRRMRAMAARIPDRETFEAFIATQPERLRDGMREMLAPHVRFKTA
jgi:hypothetical protein